MIRAHLVGTMALAGILSAGPVIADLPERSYVGYAYAPDSGELLYTEHHVETLLNGGVPVEHVVTYRDPDGKLLANKTIDYTENRLHPNFRMEDLRNGYLEGGERIEDGYRLYTRETSGDEAREKTMKIPPDFVADAGFNQFVVTQWDRLVGGAPVAIQFAAPPRLDSFQFRVRLASERTFLSRRAGVFRIEIANPLLRLFVDPILLTYDLDTRELLGFEGMTNINDADGKSYVARIEFPHGQSPVASTTIE